MSDLSHLEYLFTRDSFTGHARPDPRLLLGHVHGAGWNTADPHQGHAATAANPHPGIAGKSSDAAAATSGLEKYSNQRPIDPSLLAPYLQHGASRASSSSPGKGGAGGALARAQYAGATTTGVGPGGASADALRWAAGALTPLNGSMPMAAAAFALAQRNLLHAESAGAPGKDGSLSASPLGKKAGKPAAAAAAATTAKPAAKAPSIETADTITCQVCAQVVPSNSIRKYIRVRKVCNDCRTSDCVIKNGKNMRFCQLCSWFHPVDNFEGTRHSCKTALEKHNERRRQKTSKVNKGPDDASQSGGAEVKSESSQ